MSDFEDKKQLMIDTFNRFNGKQVDSHTKYGFFKFRFDDVENARKAFEEYNNNGGHSARENDEITVFIRKDKNIVFDESKKLEIKLCILKAAIFIYWFITISSIMAFCYFFPYNAIAIMTGIVVYSHLESYLK